MTAHFFLSFSNLFCLFGFISLRYKMMGFSCTQEKGFYEN